MKFRKLLVILSVAGLFFSFAVKGESAEIPASSSFKRGVDYFKQGDFEQALIQFEQAEQKGLDTPSLFYNVGVSFYKLERYKQAEAAFEQAASFPRFAALALYNQGLAAMKQGHLDRARLHFQDVVERAEGENIGDLAATALLKLGAKKTLPPWFSSVSFGLGYDDNVGLDADDQVLGVKEGDFFSMIYARVRGPVGSLSRRLPGLRFQGSGNYRKYFEQDNFDYGSLVLGLSYRDKAAGWKLKTGGEYAYIAYDAKSLEQIPSFNIDASRRLFRSLDFLVGLRVSYIDTLDRNYEYLKGWRQNYSTRLRWKWSRIRAMAGLGFELNDRDDENYSPTRQSLMTSVTLMLRKDVDAYLGFNYRKSDFSLTGAIDDREENRFRSVLRLSYLIDKNWLISGEYRYTSNNSNNKAYEYTRNVLALKISTSF